MLHQKFLNYFMNNRKLKGIVGERGDAYYCIILVHSRRGASLHTPL
jgi:hypothetical protein